MSSRPVVQGYTILRDQSVTASEGGADQIYPGGIVLPFLGAALLNIGDAVWLSADNTVNKSAVVGDHANFLGIVVGGDATGGEVGGGKAQFGVRAANSAAAGMNVLVQVFGAQYVVLDAATPVGPIIPSVILAGRMHAGAAPGVGKLIQAAAAAGDVRLALIR
jgi:hypothetical protein